MIEVLFPITLLVMMILGYVSVKKGWKIADYF